MRQRRLLWLLLAIYFVFVGGSSYYDLFFPIRIFHHVIVTVLLAGWLISRLRARLGMPSTALNLPLYALVPVWAISAVASENSRMAFEHLWFSFTHILILFILFAYFQRGGARHLVEVQFFLTALVIVLSVLEFASWYFGMGIIPGTEVGWVDMMGNGIVLPLELPRLALAMNISTLLAGYTAPLVTFTAAWALTTPRRDYAITLGAISILTFFILILTFSRGGLLSLLAAFVTLSIFYLARYVRISRARLFGGLIVVTFSMSLMIGGIAYISLQGNRESGDSTRLDMWQSAVEMTIDHPVVGVGPGLFGPFFREYRNASVAQDKLASAHNIILNTASETGIIGLLVSLSFVAFFVRAWYGNWREAATRRLKFRLEATLAALVGVVAHSMVDVFTTTPLVLLFALLIAYSIHGQAGRVEAKSRGSIWIPAIAVVLVLGYGVWLLSLDNAQLHYQRSLRNGIDNLAEVERAIALDPSLTLYDLQKTFVEGQGIGADADFEAVIASYLHAVELEPTWEVGWINLAALAERQGEIDEAMAYLNVARDIRPHNSASLHWARLAEQTSTLADEDIIEAYIVALDRSWFLPLSDFWSDTELRREALDRYVGTLQPDLQFRVWRVHNAERALQLVPTDPHSAAEWWIVGEQALLQDDRIFAANAFSRAIETDRDNGDYYVSRARAVWMSDAEAANIDLDMAALLDTTHEYPNAVRALLSHDPVERRYWNERALPSHVVRQEFAAVLYRREARFDIFPEMRFVGPGRLALQPWYDIAESYRDTDQIDDAVRVYRFILDYAWDEQDACDALVELGQASSCTRR